MTGSGQRRPKPLQILINLFFPDWRVSGLVDIFDPQQELSAFCDAKIMASIRRIGVPQMQRTCWRRRKTGFKSHAFSTIYTSDFQVHPGR